MAIITKIKEEIRKLDAGSFQILCDDYLFKKGYHNIVALGTQAGTTKTTKGTPDTYVCCNDGKYIFVEYTTQQSGLAKKIEKDIKKCLDYNYTKIPHNEIREIIYCHTSSNLIPEDDKMLHDICSKEGVKLSIIGIDCLAQELSVKYRSVAKDHLLIPLDTEQIQTIQEFVEGYDSNPLAAPLDNAFLFRTKEIEEINTSFEKVDVVILSGPAGIGKTKLALQYAKKHETIYGENIFCIHDKSLPIYDDLNIYFEDAGKYFIVIDDANQLSQTELIVEYVNKKKKGFDVKVLITVRDYAIEKVKLSLSNITRYEVININRFSNDEIKTIVKELLEIQNSVYLERIVEVAEGNARIALLAGKIAKDNNRLDSINDLSQLYSDYYGKALQEAKLNENNELLISLGVIAFLGSIHVDRMDSLLSLLNKYNISRDSFISNIKKLNNMEIVDFCHDKAARFSEQCLGNFVMKYVFYDKKILLLSDAIKTCFSSYKSKVIFSVNTLGNIFRNEDLHKYIEDEVKKVWDEKAENESEFWEYLKVFHPINPTETLAILDEKIEEMDIAHVDIQELDTKTGRNYQNVSDDILNILGEFVNSVDLDCALDLFFKYYIKRPDKYIQFYHTCIIYFGVQRHSWKSDYYSQIKLVRKFIEFCEMWNNELITTLFVDVAKKLLSFNFSSAESNSNNTFTFYTFSVANTEGVRIYRQLIWEQLLEIYKKGQKKSDIKSLLKSYGDSAKEENYHLIKNDADYVMDIVKIDFNSDNICDCLIAKHLKRIFSLADVNTEKINVYIENDKMKLHDVLKGPKWEEYNSYEKRKREKELNIEKLFLNEKNKTELFIKCLNIYEEVFCINNHESYEIKEGLEKALNIISNNKEDIMSVLDYVISNDKTMYISEYISIKSMLTFYSLDDVYDKISCISRKDEQNLWKYTFFTLISEEQVDQKIHQKLFDFLSYVPDTDFVRLYNRNIDFLKKFEKIDKDVVKKGVKLIFSNRESSEILTLSYLSVLFNEQCNDPKWLISKFEGNIILIEEIYIWLEIYGYMNDLNGMFIFEIYKHDSTFLTKYITAISKSNRERDVENIFAKLRIFFNAEDYICIMDVIFNKLIENIKYPTISVPSILKNILAENKYRDRIDHWIKSCICNNADNKVIINCIFEVILNFCEEQRLEYIKEFLQSSNDVEMFKKIPFIPSSYSFSGSAVPLYSSWIDFYKKILPFLEGIKYIKHKMYIEKKIENLKKMIVEAEIDDIMGK